MPVFPGRFAAQTDEPFVVFLIGLQINRMLAIHKWWKPLAAMPAMINELRRHPEIRPTRQSLLSLISIDVYGGAILAIFR
jgi:hypothetical protein